MATYRMAKVNSLIKEELSLAIRFKAKDSRIRDFVTITDVDTTRDFFQSKIFVTIFDPNGKNTEAWKQEVLKVLEKAEGYFRSLVSKVMKTKHTPALIFQLDRGIERGERIQRLIDELKIEEKSPIITENDEGDSHDL